jgi:hypothetical protein
VGGLPRRATFLAENRASNEPNLVLDSGNIYSDKPPSEAALETTVKKGVLMVELMGKLGYEGAAVGEKDLYLGLENLRALEKTASFPFLSANLAGKDGDLLFDSHAIFKKGALTIGVVGLTSPPSNKSFFENRMAGNQVNDPIKAAADIVSSIRDRCDLIVVLASLGYNQDQKLARSVEGIDIILGGKSRRFMKKATIQEGVLLTNGYFQGRAVGQITVSLQGQHLGWASREELTFIQRQIDTASERVRSPGDEERLARLLENQEKARSLTPYDYDMVSLVPDIADDPGVAAAIRNYRQSLKIGHAADNSTPSKEAPVRYIGADKCRQCHAGRYRFWSKTPHWAAFRTLAIKDAEADPDCLQCHVTGYERQTGYWPKKPRKELEGVQCEVCHGVGSLHAANPETYSLLHLPSAPQCLDCHTRDQDDNFDYLRDRKRVCGEE